MDHVILTQLCSSMQAAFTEFYRNTLDKEIIFYDKPPSDDVLWVGSEVKMFSSFPNKLSDVLSEEHRLKTLKKLTRDIAEKTNTLDPIHACLRGNIAARNDLHLSPIQVTLDIYIFDVKES